jgi:hypothetical protein
MHCLKANLSTKQQESDAQRTMGYLIQGLDRTDLGFRIDGRTVLHLALHNDRQYEVTKILLSFPEIRQSIGTDSETFIYEDSKNICMSPNRHLEEVVHYSESTKRLTRDLLMQAARTNGLENADLKWRTHWVFLQICSDSKTKKT